MMALTEQQAAILDRLDRCSGIIKQADREACPGLHWCPDWDDLPICDASPEKDGCSCRL